MRARTRTPHAACVSVWSAFSDSAAPLSVVRDTHAFVPRPPQDGATAHKLATDMGHKAAAQALASAGADTYVAAGRCGHDTPSAAAFSTRERLDVVPHFSRPAPLRLAVVSNFASGVGIVATLHCVSG